MKFLKSLFLVSMIFIFNNCKFNEVERASIYAQKIQGTSKILYKYYILNDGNLLSDYRILDSNEIFKINAKKDLDLGFHLLKEIPNKQTIQGIDHLIDNSCGNNYYKTTSIFLPLKTRLFKRDNFRIVKQFYQCKGFSESRRSLEQLSFEKFKEKGDSIYFYNLDDVISINRKHIDSIGFKKTNIEIQQTKTSDVSQITLENLIINKKNKIILNQTYFLKPKYKTKTSSFSDYGIFKEVIR